MERLKAVVDNRFRIPVEQLSGEELNDLKRLFTYENPEYAKIKAITKGRFSRKKVPEFIRTWKVEGGEFSVPRGAFINLRSRSEEEVCTNGFEVDERTIVGRHDMIGKIPSFKLTLRDYQQELEDRVFALRDALIRSPQGSGKTTLAFSYVARHNLPALVVVPTDKIFQQWVKRAQSELGLAYEDVGIIKGSTRVVRPLTIASQKTLTNCVADYADLFGVLVFDEAQKFAAKTFFEVADKMPAKHRLAVSADERRADGKEFIIYDVFGPVVHEIGRERLQAQGSIIDAEIRIVPTGAEVAWYSKLPPMKRMQGYIQTKLADVLSKDQQRNALVMEVLGWCVAEKQPVITLASRRDHCATLNSMAIELGWNSGLLMGGPKSVDEFKRTEREMRDGDLMQAVGTYKAVGVGFDLPLVTRGVFAAPCASKSGEQQFKQYCGRYERPCPDTGKRDAIVYYLWDEAVQGIGVVHRIKKWKKNVKVLHEGRWLNAADYLRVWRQREEENETVEGFQPVR